MDDRRLEVRVGLLALAAIASGAVLLYLIGSFKRAGDAHLRVDFAHSGGVPVGAPVKLAGVEVGRVTGMTLQPERRDPKGKALPVQMELNLEQEVMKQLHPGLRVGVATQGPLGEPFIEIDPGTPSSAPLADGAEVRGDDPPRLDELISQMESLVDAVHGMLTSPDGGAGDFLHDAASLTRTADGVLLENRENIAATLKNVRDAANDMRVVAQNARVLLSDPKLRNMVGDAAALTADLREQVPPLAKDARQLARSANNVAGDFTPEDGQRLKEAMAHYEAAGAQLDDIAARADKLVKEIEAGQGNAGGFVKDDQLYKDLKDLVHDLKDHPWKVIWKK